VKRCVWLLGPILVATVLVACDDDDSGCGPNEICEPSIEYFLAGTWRVTTENGQPVPAAAQYTITFNADRSGQDSDGTSFTWSVYGDELTITYASDFRVTMTYSVTGNMLILRDGTDSLVFTRI
jgi:hypothetical protein